jgi:hypothetical protein
LNHFVNKKDFFIHSKDFKSLFSESDNIIYENINLKIKYKKLRIKIIKILKEIIEKILLHVSIRFCIHSNHQNTKNKIIKISKNISDNISKKEILIKLIIKYFLINL